MSSPHSGGKQAALSSGRDRTIDGAVRGLPRGGGGSHPLHRCDPGPVVVSAQGDVGFEAISVERCLSGGPSAMNAPGQGRTDVRTPEAPLKSEPFDANPRPSFEAHPASRIRYAVILRGQS
jgi:hypothetical protein